MMSLPPAYQTLTARLRELAILRSCGALLSWDEQTNLPTQGAEHRAAQLSLLAGLAHERATSPELGHLLDELTDEAALGGADTLAAANVREARRSFERSIRLPRRLVEEISRVTTLSQQAWVEARSRSDFATFQPWLEQIVALKREEANALGSPSGLAYDALLDDYEPGATVEQVQAAFVPLRSALVELVEAIHESGRQPPVSILTRRYPVNSQEAFSRTAAQTIGFDFRAGRLDVAPHPFCSGIGPGDCRLTIRYDEYHFSGSFFGTLHEAGHGLYEQGLSPDQFGLAGGDACSLGIHESQSRLWENLVGRSLPFWEFFYPRAKEAFPDALADVGLTAFYEVINDVRPSWIRVEADEVTYNLHIMLRFELEQALISGQLLPGDLPGAWNDRFTQDFGMTPPDDARGCLQDVHWSAGLIGYFPTYSLGNMYASQFFEKADADLGGLAHLFRKGDFAPLRDWLHGQIHSRGRRYEAPKLVELVTGAPPDGAPLLRHLREKYGALYRLH